MYLFIQLVNELTLFILQIIWFILIIILFFAYDNDNDNDNNNDNEIDLCGHHNGNNTNTKVIFKQMTLLDKCNCI